MKAALFTTTRAETRIDITLEDTPRKIVINGWYRQNPNDFRDAFADQLAPFDVFGHIIGFRLSKRRHESKQQLALGGVGVDVLLFSLHSVWSRESRCRHA